MNPVAVPTPAAPSATPPTATPVRLGVLAAVVLMTGCTTTGDGLFSGDKVDYRTTAAKTVSLEVPPDLTQLARDGRYQPQGGVVSAAAAGTAGTAATAGAPVASAAASVALNSLDGVRVARDGQQRWLVVGQSPEKLWPLVRAFWEQRGFTLIEANPQTGVMQTSWAENRAKLPTDFIRNTIGKLFSNAYDTGERDSYRTRIERTAGGSEIYISHRGVQEIYTNERNEATTWRARATDPQLEAEFLSGLMVALGSKGEPARNAVAAAAPASGTATAPAARVAAAPQATSLNLDEGFDRAWRRVGVALDRSGFTVEDRDRSAGLYFVRYVDPKSAGKEEPGWWAKLFGDSTNPLATQRYRVVVKTTAGKTAVSVQTSAGAPEAGDNAKAIIGRLGQELK